jgi:hypothetical protein
VSDPLSPCSPHCHHPPGVEVSCSPPARRQRQPAWFYSPCGSPNVLSPLVSPACSPTRHRPAFPPYLPVFPSSPSTSCSDGAAACTRFGGCLSPLGRPLSPSVDRLSTLCFSSSPESAVRPQTLSSTFEAPPNPTCCSLPAISFACSPCVSPPEGGAAAAATCPLCEPGAAQVLLCPPAAINYQFALLARPDRDHNGRVTAEYFRQEWGGRACWTALQIRSDLCNPRNETAIRHRHRLQSKQR